jgi:uncharacterized protein YidB (DUF937 family)
MLLVLESEFPNFARVSMSFLNDAIDAALRQHNVQQVGATGSSSLADALRSLLAPKSADSGLAADATHAEPDALHELFSQFERSGYGDIIRSWIGVGQNQPIEPEQVGAALGPRKIEELSDDTGLPRETLLDQLARLLPTIIDRLTPQGRLPGSPERGA